MDDTTENTNTKGNKSVTSTFNYKIDESSTEIIHHEALQDSGNLAINAEWSETSSVFSSSSSNSHMNTETYKECCANPSDTLKNKEDFMILESTSTDVNTSNFNINDTDLSTRKVTHFQKLRKPYSSNSHVFENILADDSEMEITQNSVCLNRFQKRRKLSSPNDNIFVEINKSDYNNGMNSAEVSMISSKCFSKKIRDQSYFEIPDYNLSSADTTSTLIVDANVSKVKKNPTFKIPSDSSVLVNDCTYNIMDESKTELLTQKFTRKTIDTSNSAFDNIINNSSITSVNISNVSKNLSCSTMDLPSLNHTYDIPAIGNSTQIALLSQSVKNNSELLNISIRRPMNETYNLENDLMSNKTNYIESNKSINLKNTHSDTFTIENNSNKALDQPKSTNKTINTLANTSNIYNQSNLSVQKSKFIRKLQLDTVPQDYNITNDDSNSTINDKFNKSERFKLKKTCHDGDSKIFDNIMSSQESETSQNTNISNDNISNILNVSAETSNNNDLRNLSSESKFTKNIEESMDKSLTQESNVLLDEVVETNISMNQSDFLLKFKSSNSYIRPSGKFNFSKRFGRLSQSYQENNMNVDALKQHTISINTDFNKTLGEKSNILNEFENSKVSDIQENHTSEIIQQFNDLLSSTLSNTSIFKQSQSQTPPFTGKHVLTAHSGVFSDLIDHSLNSDSSMNISKQVKFKNHKNIHDDQSIVFENVIKNSQELNFTLNQNDTLGHIVLYDQSTIQDDEISMFANTDELLSNSKSPKNSDYSFKKLDISNTINVKESKLKGNKLNDLNITSCDSALKHSLEKDSVMSNISIVNNKQCNSEEPAVSVVKNNTLCEKNNSLRLEESINNNAGLLENDSLQSNRQTTLSSKSLLASNNTDLCCKSNEIFGDYNSNTSNHSISVISNNENLSNKLLLSDNSTSSTSNDEGLTLMITTTGLSESDISLRSNTTSINETNSISSINETNSVSSKNSLSSTSTNQKSTLLTTTAGSFGSTRSSRNQSNSIGSSRYSTLENEGLTILNTSARSSENMSISQSKASTSKNSLPVNTKDMLNVSSKSLMSEDNINNSSRKSTRSSNQNKNSLNNTLAISKVTDGLIKKKKSSSTQVTKSSLASTVSKSLLKKTLINSISENNVNYNISTHSSRTSRTPRSLINSNDDLDDDDSIFWTTIADNTANKPIQNVNTFQTPRNNKLAVEEEIINTIGLMSVNKHKATHPGVFELEDHRPLTRSTSVQTFNQSPSILTKALAGNNPNETMFDDLQSLSETIIDNKQVEETVTIKFKSLYNKEPWITKRLYNFVVSKLIPKYNIYSVKYAEKFIKYLASIMKQVYPRASYANVDLQLHTDMLRYHMARYGIINDTFDYMGFLTDYIPVPYYKKLMPNETPDAKVKFDQNKNFYPLMEDEEFLNQILDYFNAA